LRTTSMMSTTASRLDVGIDESCNGDPSAETSA
jgi:hypothetical protein